jgi:hypothetical protein
MSGASGDDDVHGDGELHVDANVAYERHAYVDDGGYDDDVQHVSCDAYEPTCDELSSSFRIVLPFYSPY